MSEDHALKDGRLYVEIRQFFQTLQDFLLCYVLRKSSHTAQVYLTANCLTIRNGTKTNTKQLNRSVN